MRGSRANMGVAGCEATAALIAASSSAMVAIIARTSWTCTVTSVPINGALKRPAETGAARIRATRSAGLR
ncbi:MAG TPA: hypothetical protein VFC19_31800 [Candidatus Limnocylindrales bacterium]|nr:hypothetical protein [Candidatus Limnocylindrales bacterium]